MKLSEVWLAYCETRFPNEASLPPPEPLAPWDAIELFFDLHPMFTAQYDIINSVPFDTSFDEEADGALCQLAMVDSFDGWDAMSAGAWRVMSERLLWSQTVLAVNAARETEVIAHLPIGLDRQSKARALMLMYLFGGGRSIDSRMLRERPDGRFPGFPADRPIRKQ